MYISFEYFENKNMYKFKFYSSMDRELFVISSFLQLSTMYMILRKRKKSKRWKNRKWLVRPINTRRMQQGDFQHLFQEMKEDPDLFFRYTRMDMNTFSILLTMLFPYLSKKSPKALAPEQRLAITLRYFYCFEWFIINNYKYFVPSSVKFL